MYQITLEIKMIISTLCSMLYVWHAIYLAAQYHDNLYEVARIRDYYD